MYLDIDFVQKLFLVVFLFAKSPNDLATATSRVGGRSKIGAILHDAIFDVLDVVLLLVLDEILESELLVVTSEWIPSMTRVKEVLSTLIFHHGVGQSRQRRRR